MDRQQIGLKLAMDSLGIPVQMGTFEDRLVLQKAVYLAEAAEVALGYHFRWYLRGPYCSLLASDGFSVETSQDEADQWTLDGDSLENLRGIQSLMQKSRPADMELAPWLELLASVHFLVSRKQVAHDDIHEILSTLEKYNKRYDKPQVQRALRRLRKHGLLRVPA